MSYHQPPPLFWTQSAGTSSQAPKIRYLRGPWVSEETVAYVSKQNKRIARNSRVRIMSLWLQVVYLVQSNSKFTDQVTETMFGVIPCAVKIDRAIHSLLDHCLSPTGCSLVIIYIKGAWTVWVDCVNIVDPSTRFVQLSAVLSYWR